MSYNFIDQFLEHIYKIIQQIDSIKEGKIKGIHFNVNSREDFPCIYIITKMVEDKSKFDQKIYQVEFEISAHDRHYGNQFLNNLASEIKEVLIKKNCSFKDHEVIGIANNKIEFEQARDLVSSKVTMNYKAMIVRR